MAPVDEWSGECGVVAVVVVEVDRGLDEKFWGQVVTVRPVVPDVEGVEGGRAVSSFWSSWSRSRRYRRLTVTSSRRLSRSVPECVALIEDRSGAFGEIGRGLPWRRSCLPAACSTSRRAERRWSVRLWASSDPGVRVGPVGVAQSRSRRW